MGKTIRYPFSSHHWRKSVAIMTIAAVVSGTAAWNVSPSPIAAATAPAGQQETLRLKVGSTSATLNGEKLAIVKPYVRQGTTMVPLSIFTNVFDADLKWEQDNAVILEGDAVSIRMRIGQKQAMLNGKLVTLAVAPEMTGGTAMVPLKQVAQAFGATYSVDKDKSIVLHWKQAGNLAGAAVDVSTKAARVGDSYYQWNMVLPKGWAHESLSPEEFAVIFTDPTEHVYVTINALDWASKPLEHWADTFKGQASEQQLMEYLQTEELDDESEMYEASTGKVDGIAYAQSVFINEEDMYLARMFSANGKRYIVRIFDTNAQRPKQMLQYVPLINTFRPSFSAGAATNISSVKDGYRNTELWGKGLTMDLPVEWASSDTYFQSYGSKNWEQSVNYNIATAAPGLTIDQFAKDHLSYMKKTTKSEYLQVDPVQDVKLADGKMAKSMKVKSRVDEQNWKVSMHLLVVDQGVQYLMIYHCPDNSEGVTLGNRLFSSVKVDGSVKKDLESPEDFPKGEEWYKDWSVSSTRKAPNYGFTLQVPDWWTSGFYAWGEENYDVELDEGMIAYYSRPDSDFSVYVDQVRTVEEALARWEDYYKGEGDTKVEIVKQEKTTVQGNKAYAIEMKVFSEAGQLSFTVNLLLIAREGKVFSLVYSMEDTARTPELLDSFKRTMESFQFTEQVTNKKS
ncbi:stalk domain-containing protein [Paenibacillus alvei]|uniref:Copper amine oxidase domain protein n=1 Tax=Paenibacillus alvei TaxID=44250 RepID=A0A383RJJ8_PAEAL|nr:copper amine oxidase N-terminal domain-containing protein [Paenibacillus alvei]SYX86466.1 Copper amine oxidase domain protein [Paenibacillus alvei]